MKYKLLISDYDGTLAGRDHLISSTVQESIKKWVKTGHDFSIATGRCYTMIQNEVKELGLKTPQITRGGAEIVDPITHSVLYSKLIDKETVGDFINFLKENKYQLVLEEEDKFYSNFDFNSGYANTKHLNLDEFTLRPVPKFFISINNKNFDEAERFLEEVLLKKYPQLHIVRSYSPLGKAWDVTSLEATKHSAILELMKLLSVKREDVVGVGDGYNDFPLLEACGLKVAMGNANEELKAVADIVVPSYQEDGVAVLIEKLLHEE